MQEKLVAFVCSVLVVALVGCRESYKETDLAFNRAVAAGNLEESERLLQEGANINMKFNNEGGQTNLTMVAGSKGYSPGLRFLLDHGADPNLPTNDGKTALMIAASFGTAEYVAILLEHGADPTATTPDGSTALAYAEKSDNAETVRLLKAALAGDNAS